MKVIECPDGYYERCRWLVSKATEINGTIIDIGCADAFMFRDIAQDRTTFIDNSQIAQKKCKGLNFHLADAHNLPFPDKSFDVAILGEVLEHVANPVAVLREAKRVAKHIFITTPNEWEWKAEQRPFSTLGHIRFYTEETLEKDLKEGLENGYFIFKIVGGGWSFFGVEWHQNTV